MTFYIFDNFYAMPYGPVESDVYNAIQEDKLPSFSVKYRSIEPREGAEPYNAKRYNDKFYHRVRNAVNDLREKNEKLRLLIDGLVGIGRWILLNL